MPCFMGAVEVARLLEAFRGNSAPVGSGGAITTVIGQRLRAESWKYRKVNRIGCSKGSL